MTNFHQVVENMHTINTNLSNMFWTIDMITVEMTQLCWFGNMLSETILSSTPTPARPSKSFGTTATYDNVCCQPDLGSHMSSRLWSSWGVPHWRKALKLGVAFFFVMMFGLSILWAHAFLPNFTTLFPRSTNHKPIKYIPTECVMLYTMNKSIF